MLPFKHLKSFGKFAGNVSGNIAMTTAILAPVLFASAGMVLDYSRALNTRVQLNNALDAAVLAAGNDLTRGVPVDDTFRENFENFLNANLIGRNINLDDLVISRFEADEETGDVSAKVETKINTSFMRLAGKEEINIATESSATFSVEDVEVAIMLDTTGSMRGQKLADLKQAAIDTVNLLLPDNRTRGMRISIVPYAGSVNVGKRIRNRVTRNNQQVANIGNGNSIAAIDRHGANNTCVTERGGSNAETDASYRTSPIGNDQRTEDNSFKCPKRAKLQPLTSNKSKLLNTISKLEATGVTAGHLGIAWSYYTLSENWADNRVFPSESQPARYGEAKKIAILMTDGEFNTYYHGTTDPSDPNDASSAFGGSNIGKSNNLATDLCDHMKTMQGGKERITVYSIAFKAPKSAEKTLRKCANPDTADETFYFSAENGAELRNAFSEIAASILRLRISR